MGGKSNDEDERKVCHTERGNQHHTLTFLVSKNVKLHMEMVRGLV